MLIIFGGKNSSGSYLNDVWWYCLENCPAVPMNKQTYDKVEGESAGAGSDVPWAVRGHDPVPLLPSCQLQMAGDGTQPHHPSPDEVSSPPGLLLLSPCCLTAAVQTSRARRAHGDPDAGRERSRHGTERRHGEREDGMSPG
eukprot:746547-Hanusia_phi.AAC.6